jgi:hypothetical protein
VETTGSNADNWYFILPNMHVETSQGSYSGVAIKLYDGVVISWDGRVIKHCTSVTDIGPGQCVSSVFWAAKTNVKYIEK